MLLNEPLKEVHILLMENCEHYDYINFSLKQASDKEKKFCFPQFQNISNNFGHLVNGLSINQIMIDHQVRD